MTTTLTMNQSAIENHSTPPYFQWERNKQFNKELYATNKKYLLSFIMQAGAHFRLEQLITFEVLSLIEHFFIMGSFAISQFTLKEMKMICLGSLSIRLKLNEYRAIASSLISSISLADRRMAVNNEIALYELIVLREFNYDIIGMANIGLTLFYSLIRVNSYFIQIPHGCYVFNIIALVSNGVIKFIRSSIMRIIMLFSFVSEKKLK